MLYLDICQLFTLLSESLFKELLWNIIGLSTSFYHVNPTSNKNTSYEYVSPFRILLLTHFCIVISKHDKVNNHKELAV